MAEAKSAEEWAAVAAHVIRLAQAEARELALEEAAKVARGLVGLDERTRWAVSDAIRALAKG